VEILAQGKLSAVERAAAGVNLAHLGDPRPGIGLRADVLPDIAWCEIPAGPFLMGDQKQEVTLPAYKISQYPVTNAQFRAFVEDKGYQEESYWPEAIEAGNWREGRVERYLGGGWDNEPYGFGPPFNLANHPVVGVSWYEAMAFCRWLSARSGEQVTLTRREPVGKSSQGYGWSGLSLG
jgi:formylglycine-generating enzyme required for sulfatase activity